MKKVLLSSVALATAAVSFAAVNVNGLSASAVERVDAAAMQSSVEAVKLAESQNATFVAASADEAGSTIAKAGETGEPIPAYAAPAGMFYFGNVYLFDFPNNSFTGLYDGTVLLGSPHSSYTWRNTSKNATTENKFTWRYLDVAATNASDQGAVFATVNTVDYVSTAENALFTYSSTGSFITFGPQLSIEGSDSIYSTSVQYGLDTYKNLNYQGASREGFSIVYTYNYLAKLEEAVGVSYTDVTNFADSTETWYQSQGVAGDMVGYGMVVPQPQAQYGLQGVAFRCAAPVLPTDDVRVVVYKIDAEGRVTGDVLASGKVAAKDVPWHVTAWSNIYVPMLIEDPDLGDVNTVVNIDCPVFIAIETKADVSLAGMMMTNRDVEGAGSSYYLAKNGDTYNVANVSAVNFGGGRFIKNLAMGLDVTTAWMNEENNDYEFKAPVAGGNKQFTIDALYRLDAEAAVADIYGEGMDDWYTVDVTNENVMTVTVKALPAGTAGRSSDLVVYTPGAERTFKITQGEVTGIDEIGADNADVLSVEYYDLQGRKLNAEPENGIFIQKNLLSNGKTVATKVAK